MFSSPVELGDGLSFRKSISDGETCQVMMDPSPQPEKEEYFFWTKPLYKPGGSRRGERISG
jgi:hypothetical protein